MNAITKLAEALATLTWEQEGSGAQPRDRRFSFTLRPGLSALVEVRFLAPVHDHASGKAYAEKTVSVTPVLVAGDDVDMPPVRLPVGAGT